MPDVEEALAKVEYENTLLKKKLQFTRRATEHKILENITNEDFYTDDPHLVVVLSAAIEDDFELVPEDEKDTEPTDSKLVHRSRKDKFLSSLEDKVDKSNAVHLERLSHIQEQVVERIRSTKIKRLTARTNSAKRRLSLSLDEFSGRSSSRPRTASPAAQS